MREKFSLKGELVGEDVEILGSKNESLIGLKGKIIDETKNTLRIKTEKGNKTLIKNQIEIMFTKHNKKIKGEQIQKRPEERIKRL